MFDTTSDGCHFTVLSRCDEFSKECPEGPLGRSITAEAVAVALDKAALIRGLPEHIRCDNGPEFIAAAIQHWCRQSGAERSFIDPGSRWQNPYVERFNSRAKSSSRGRRSSISSTPELALIEGAVLASQKTFVRRVGA